MTVSMYNNILKSKLNAIKQCNNFYQCFCESGNFFESEFKVFFFLWGMDNIPSVHIM